MLKKTSTKESPARGKSLLPKTSKRGRRGFGRKLIKAILIGLKKGITQQEIANRIGCSQAFVSAVKRGKTHIDVTIED